MHPSIYNEMEMMQDTHWWFVGRSRVLRSLINDLMEVDNPKPSRLKICELGCGPGGLLASLSEHHEVCGLEPSSDALKFARKKLGNRVVMGKLPDDIPFQPEIFDVVILADVLEHVERDAEAAKAAFRLVREGGVLIATVPAHPWLYAPRDRLHHHFRRYEKKTFEKVLTLPSAQFELLSFYNSFLFPPAVMARFVNKLVSEASTRDLWLPPKPVNWLLSQVFSSERFFLRRFPLPVGLSLIGVIRKGAQKTDGRKNALQ